jgi:hypothetical protein
MKHLSLNDDLIAKICRFVEEGMCFRDAYLLSGVNKHTGGEWRKSALNDIKEGKTEEESIFVRLSNRMDEAKARYHKGLVRCVNEAGKDPKNWQAAMTLLERVDPETYSRFNKLKQYEELGLDPKTQSPLELTAGILRNALAGKISMDEGRKFSDIIGNLIKVDENTKGWEIINQLKQEMKK